MTRKLPSTRPHTVMNDFAGFLNKQRRYDEAESLYCEAVTGKRRSFGTQHPSTLASAQDLAMMLHKRVR